MTEKPKRYKRRQTETEPTQGREVSYYVSRYRIPPHLQPLFEVWITQVSGPTAIDALIELRDTLLYRERASTTDSQEHRSKEEAIIFLLLVQYIAEETKIPFRTLLRTVFET
jgi:hypothetical protein